MITEDALRRLAVPDDVRPAPARPLADVRRRADRLRLRRRAGIGLAGGATGLAAAVLAGVPLPFSGAASIIARIPAALPDLGIGCATGFAEQIPYAKATDLLYLPDSAVAGPIAGEVFVRSERNDCPYAHVAGQALRREEGAVGASFTVSGPDAGPMLPDGAQFGDGTVVRSVDARGRTVRIAATRQPGRPPLVRATWTEPDRTTWSVQRRQASRYVLVPFGSPDPSRHGTGSSRSPTAAPWTGPSTGSTSAPVSSTSARMSRRSGCPAASRPVSRDTRRTARPSSCSGTSPSPGPPRSHAR